MRHDGVQEAGEARIDIVSPQRDQAAHALGPGARHTGLAQDREVMRHRRARHALGEKIA
jgi:hypothetical protein